MSVGWFLMPPTDSAPTPTATATATESPKIHRAVPATPAPPTAASSTEVTIAASAPLRLRVPSIGLDGAVSEYTQAMIEERGGFDPSELTTISWDTTISGGTAGTDSTNTVYLYGHSAVESAVFNSLKDVPSGAVASVDTANGRLCYVEQKTLQLNKSEYKYNDELTDAIPNRLVLVSCYRPSDYNPDAATVQNIVVVMQLDQAQTTSGC
ncbi:class F sortase [Cryobacterium sp. M15]|uniref:class F sortase n=1 Tax=Cryobacterium sp. M15 TaxID=2048291 RepID=UPI003518881D